MRSLAPLLLALLVVAVFLRIEFFFTVVYFLAAVLLLARFWIRRGLRQLSLERRFLNRAFAGDEVPMELRLKNEGWLPLPWLSVAETLPVELAGAPQGQVVSMPGHGRWQFEYRIKCRKRGYYSVGPLRAEIGDLLGLEQHRFSIGQEESLIVYPRVLPLAELGLPARSPQVVLAAPSSLFEDPSRVVGVRDYRRGDAPRSLHWRATARMGRPMVKQYQPALARETMICLDLDEEGYDRHLWYESTELAITIAASLASQLVSGDGLPVGLATEALDPLVGEQRLLLLPPRAEQAFLLGSVLEVLARVRVGRGQGFAALLRRAVLGLSYGSTVVAITGKDSPGLLPDLLLLRRSGFAVTLLLVQPYDLSPDLLRQATGVGITTRRVWIDGSRLARM